MPSKDEPSLIANPQSYFSELVKQGLAQRKIKTYPMVIIYLSDLMLHYVDARNLFDEDIDQESGKRNPRTLAEMLLTAQISSHTTKTKLLKRLADRSLYVSGFFGDSLNRSLVDLDYYRDMGVTAYQSLAQNTREDTLAKVFHEMSVRFLEFVDVFTEMSQLTLTQTNKDILRLYEVWLRTGSELAREKLLAEGVLTSNRETNVLKKLS